MSQRDLFVTIVGIVIVYALIIIQATKASPPQPPINSGDANNSGTVTMSDVVYLINYIFGGGPAPVPCPSLQFDGKTISVDTNWVRARVGDRVMPRGFDWYYLTDNSGHHWIATPDTIQWGFVDTTLTEGE